MLCDNCKKRQASIHITKIINGEKREVHLCEQCTSLEQIGDNVLNFKNFITNFTNLDDGLKKNYGQINEPACDHCGMTYEMFKKYGKFGCEHCYDAFEPMISPMIKRMQGKDVHIGKIVNNGGEDIRKKREIEELNQKLRIAVEKEAYEQAAVYRDMIKELSKEIEKKG
ncbi:MAG TPA: hypothetical protein DCG38_10655 [Eubacteriaceae bacterium]|jgi:protein arginine kinase activator|nr:hypothetical protein [Eubacteriaceae bacterium]